MCWLSCEKSKRLPFAKSTNQASDVLELIHSDLMRPTKTTSYSGCRYAMISVDDFSRFNWIYILKHKNEAFSRFLDFKQRVEHEFGRNIKCLLTDNGGEYVLEEFLAYCEKERIQ